MKYIDAYAGFIDESGGFSPYGPDVTGKIRLLREGDGVYFTAARQPQARPLRRARRAPRSRPKPRPTRAIPLAGAEAEQAKINPDKAKLAEASAGH